jgi:hypothetical protein
MHKSSQDIVKYFILKMFMDIISFYDVFVTYDNFQLRHGVHLSSHWTWQIYGSFTYKDMEEEISYNFLFGGCLYILGNQSLCREEVLTSSQVDTTWRGPKNSRFLSPPNIKYESEKSSNDFTLRLEVFL